jgi:hypothetical protein
MTTLEDFVVIVQCLGTAMNDLEAIEKVYLYEIQGVHFILR